MLLFLGFVRFIQDWLRDVLPDIVEKVPRRAALVQCRIMAVFVAKYMNLLLCSLRQELAQISKVAISRQQTEA